MIVRSCVRAILQTTDQRVLLMRVVDPSDGRAFWITPGGGVDNGETDRDALRRELEEETSYTGNVDGPLVWTRDFTYPWDGELYRQFERFYWLKTADFTAEPTHLDPVVEARSFDVLHWWSLEDIEASSDVFVPRDMHARLVELHRNGPPRAPAALGE